MGKANRIKTEKAQQTLATPVVAKKKAAKKAIPAWLGTTILIVVLLAIALTATFFALDNAGTFKRMRTVLKTENFKVTVPMMTYMVSTEYQSLVSQYDGYSEQFGITVSIPSGKGGKALDKTKPLSEQIYATQDDKGNALPESVTWLDHFVELATADVKKMLTVCEAALAAGVELSDEDLDSIDVTLETTELYAAYYYNYTLDGYLTAMYGENVIEKDVRAMMEISALSAKYNEIKSDEILAGVTDDQVQKEYDDNNLGDKKNKYEVFIDYIGYNFTATFTPSTNKDEAKAKEENEKNAAKYEEKKAKYQELSNELKKAAEEDPANFVNKLRAVLQELFFEEEKEAALAKKTGATPTLTDAEIQTCRNTADQRAADAAVAAIVKNADTSATTMDSDLKKWLGDEKDLRKSGDVFRDVDERDAFGNAPSADKEEDEANKGGEYKDASSSYAVYLTTSGLHKNTSMVRSVGHILFSADTYKNLKSSEKLSGPVKILADRVLAKNETLSAELMAKELLALMKEEGKLVSKTENGKTFYVMDENVFKAYGEQYTEDSSVLYDDVKEGQMVKTFDSWLFDDARAMGEVTYPSAVETEHGFHIMLYRGDEKPAWSNDIRNDLAKGRYDEWLKAQQDAMNFLTDNSANEKYVSMIAN